MLMVAIIMLMRIMLMVTEKTKKIQAAISSASLSAVHVMFMWLPAEKRTWGREEKIWETDPCAEE